MLEVDQVHECRKLSGKGVSIRQIAAQLDVCGIGGTSRDSGSVALSGIGWVRLSPGRLAGSSRPPRARDRRPRGFAREDVCAPDAKAARLACRAVVPAERAPRCCLSQVNANVRCGGGRAGACSRGSAGKPR